MTVKVFNLACDQNHLFEGWFSSQEDFENQKTRGLLVCPICGSSEIQKRPSATYLSGSAKAKEKVDVVKLRQHLMAYVRDVAAKAEDVGDRFAEEARAINRGNAPQRMIRGSCSLSEAEKLVEEGVNLLPIPETTGKTIN